MAGRAGPPRDASGTATCATCSPRTRAGRAADRRGRRPVPGLQKHRITDETMALLLAVARAAGVEERRAAMFARRPHQPDRGSRRPPHRAPRARATRGSSSTARTSSRTSTRSWTAWRRFALTRPRRRVEGLHRQADPQRRQHRHRRIRPRARDGHRGAAPLHRPVDALPVRVQHRRHGHPRRDHRPRPGRDAVRRRVQDVHDARDADQRPHRARLAARRAGRRGRGARSTSSPCRPTRRRSASSASTPRTCSGSGTGSAAGTRWTPRSACR